MEESTAEGKRGRGRKKGVKLSNDKLKYPRLDGESEEEYKKRCNKLYKRAHYLKKKGEAEKERKEKHAALKAAQDATNGDDHDFFVDYVVGRDNFMIRNPKKKFMVCSKAVATRMNIEQWVRHQHVERRPPKNVGYKCKYESHWDIGFHTDGTTKAGDEEERIEMKEIHKLPVVPWLTVKKSGIDEAGCGLFAATDFNKEAVIGLHMGGKRGLKNYAVGASWTEGKKAILCYPFTANESMADRSTKTMGMQMMNDPTLSLKDGEEAQFEVNAQINFDLFVQAKRDIKKGEEIFIDYGWEEGSSGMSEESNESSGGGSSGSNESEESDGDKKPKAKNASEDKNDSDDEENYSDEEEDSELESSCEE